MQGGGIPPAAPPKPTGNGNGDEPKEDYLVVPFTVTKDTATESKEIELVDFPEPATLAALYLDIEANRRHRSLLSSEEENVVFLGRVYYPLSIFEWDDGRHLVLDPMGLWEHAFTHQRITDADVLEEILNAVEGIEDMDESLTGAKAALDRVMGTDSVTVKGVLFHEGFLNDLLQHLQLVKKRGASKGFLHPKLSRESLAESLKQLKELMGRVNEEVARLQQFSEYVDRKSSVWIGMIDTKIAQLKEEYEQRIRELRPVVEEAVRGLEAKKAEEIAALRMSIKEQERELARAVAKQRQHEVKYGQLKRARSMGPEIERHRVEIQAAKQAEGVAKHQISLGEKGIAQAERKHKELIQREWDKIAALSKERADKEAALRLERQAVTKAAGDLMASANDRVREKRGHLEFLDSMGVMLPPASKADVVYMQIFVALLEMQGRQRFLVYPPMIARNQKSLFSWLKQLLGRTVTPLEPKTRQFDKVFKAQLQDSLRSDQVFAEEVSSAGSRNNVLLWADIGEVLADGMDTLRDQGWLTPKQWKEAREAVLVLYPTQAMSGAGAPAPSAPAAAPGPAGFVPPHAEDDGRLPPLPPPDQ